MKLLHEKILSFPEQSFTAIDVKGPVIDCRYHAHPEYELTLVVSSFGTLFVNDTFSLFDTGSLHLMGRLVPHTYLNSASDSTGAEWGHVRVIQFEEDILPNLPEFKLIRKMLSESSHGLEFPPETMRLAVEPMEELVRTEHGCGRFLLLLQILDLLSHSDYKTISTGMRTEPDSTADKRIVRALDRIHAGLEYGTLPDLETVAEKAGFTPEGFSRFFRRTTGKNFIEYITLLRIGKASNLLMHSNMNISEICYASGFANLSNFNRHFARIKKMSPREFRKNVKKI